MKTVTIDRNIEFCNDLDLALEHYYPCPRCNESPNDNKKCPECQGTGFGQYKEYPFEVSLADQQFEVVFKDFGLDVEDQSGEWFPHKVEKMLDKVVSDEVIDCDIKDIGRIGLAQSDVDSFVMFASLRMIAREAERREEMVIWF